MQVMEKRSYHQTRRAEATEATRQRILVAARDLLVSGEDFTIEAVATRADVSRVTVYAQFGSRDELREAVFDHLGTTGGLTEIPSIFGESDPVEGVRQMIGIFCRFYATHRIVLRRLNALAALAAGDGGRPLDRNQRRRQILAVLLSRAIQLPVYSELDVDETVGVLQALTSFEFYDQLAENVGGIDPADRIWALAATLFSGQNATVDPS